MYDIIIKKLHRGNVERKFKIHVAILFLVAATVIDVAALAVAEIP